MILAPPENETCISFFLFFYFMSQPFEFRAEILHIYMYFLRDTYFISSTQAFSQFYFYLYSYFPTAAVKKSPAKLKDNKTLA